MIPLVMVLKQENVNTVTMKNDGIDSSFINLQQEEEKQEGEDKEYGNSILENFTQMPLDDDPLGKLDVFQRPEQKPTQPYTALPSKSSTSAGSDINRLFKFPLIPVLIVSSSLAVAAFIYVSLVVWGRFQRKRTDSIDFSSSILVPPRAIVHSSFGRDGYFRPWSGPSYNQFFYRSLSIDNLYRQYQNTKNSIPSIFLPSHRGKNKSSSITANQRLLLIPRVSIPRAHLQSRNNGMKIDDSKMQPSPRR